MKTQQEATIQYSGYPLRIADENLKSRKAELTVIKSVADEQRSEKKSITNDPKNWDVDWFNSYE